MTPKSEQDRSVDDSMTEDLNPAFLHSRGIVVLKRTEVLLTIACTGGLTAEDQAALKFATGAEIEITELPAQQIGAGLAPILETELLPGRTAEPFQTAAEDRKPRDIFAPDRTPQTSLMDLLGERLHWSLRSCSPLAPLAALLEAGYSSREAGGALIGTYGPASAVDPLTSALANRLAAGTTLGEAVEQDTQTPRWLRMALSACHNETSQISAFVRLIELDRTAAVSAAEIRRKRLDCGMIWGAAVLASFLLAMWAGVFVAALALAGMIWFHELSAPKSRTDATRARVLGMLEVVASLDQTPSAAIRASMASLDAVSPTWGALPDTREGFADALALPPLSRALLTKGPLCEAAGLAARQHAIWSERKLAWCSRLNSRIAAALFAAALIVKVAQ